MKHENVNIREVYQLLDEMRKELGGSIARLENKFDNLEAGRLTALEQLVSSQKAEIDPVKKIVYGLVAFILLAVLGAVIQLIIR